MTSFNFFRLEKVDEVKHLKKHDHHHHWTSYVDDDGDLEASLVRDEVNGLAHGEVGGDGGGGALVLDGVGELAYGDGDGDDDDSVAP